jgi:hypothetical protein
VVVNENLSGPGGHVECDSDRAGWFAYDIVKDSWTWSDAMFRIHGFEPGQVVPTTELLLSHKHPEDVVGVQQCLARAIDDAQRVACMHRLVDARRRVRNVVAVVDADTGPDGVATRLHGYLIDITRAMRRATSRDVDEAVAGATAHRRVIDQAKGILMLAYGIDADEAFGMLAEVSQNNNVKVNALAHRLVEHSQHSPAGSAQLRMVAERLLNRVVEDTHDLGPGGDADTPSATA